MSDPLHATGPSWADVLWFEWVKMKGRRIYWVAFLVLALVVALIVTVFHHVEFKHMMALFQVMHLNLSRKQDFVNAYYMAAHAMNPVFQLLIPIFITVAAGLMVAGEAEGGTLRACLVRPVARRRLLLTKFGLLALYSLALSFFYLTLLLSAGVLNFGTGSLYTLNVFFHNGQEGVSTVVAADVPLRFVYAGVLASMGMTVLASLALLVSALVETSAMAYVVTLSIYFAAMTLRLLGGLDWLYPYLFVTHMMRWQQCFYAEPKWGDIYVSMIHLGAYVIVFLAAAIFLFDERDIKS
jgi:ABC-2 type transport system permease protein